MGVVGSGTAERRSHLSACGRTNARHKHRSGYTAHNTADSRTDSSLTGRCLTFLLFLSKQTTVFLFSSSVVVHRGETVLGIHTVLRKLVLSVCIHVRDVLIIAN